MNLTIFCAALTLVTAGEFQKIYDPSVGRNEPWYINDHCFVRSRAGAWHMIGITHEEPARPQQERNFAHATAASLTAPNWKTLPFALTWDSSAGETLLWSPHVVEDKGTYFMFYCAGGAGDDQYRIHLATSKDLAVWQRHAANPLSLDGYHARDPFVLRDGGKWIMYYTATTTPQGGNHIVAAKTSGDLVHWGERTVVYTDPSTGTFGGPTESPFVIRRGPWYYLFIGPRGNYDVTEVFRSRNPLNWDIADKVGRIPAHAAEVVRDVDGKWYVSRAGWKRGGVYLAPLTWHDGLDAAETSMPPGK